MFVLRNQTTLSIEFLLYQVWDKDNVNKINNKRKVGYMPSKEWVNRFNDQNESLKKNSKPLFTPTTIMETEDEEIYAFVIHKAKINSSGHVVFTVSTKEISLQDNISKKLIKLPLGEFNNMRFDIDYAWDYSGENIDALPKDIIKVGKPYCFKRDQLTWGQQNNIFYSPDWYYISVNLPRDWVKDVDYFRDKGDPYPWAYVCGRQDDSRYD